MDARGLRRHADRRLYGGGRAGAQAPARRRGYAVQRRGPGRARGYGAALCRPGGAATLPAPLCDVAALELRGILCGRVLHALGVAYLAGPLGAARRGPHAATGSDEQRARPHRTMSR
ncbi:hypothetical protein BLAT2472_20876 [Burkholderia latens]